MFSVLASVILIGTMVFFGYRLYKKRKETGYLIRPPEPPRPAHEIALEAIEALMKKDLIAEGLIKEFYIEISEIIRRYIEGRFFIPALEETSSEILRELKNQDIDEEIQIHAKEFLELSDLVKFAKYKPVDEENQNIISLSKEFIEATMVIYEIENTSDISETDEKSEQEIENETTEAQSTQSSK